MKNIEKIINVDASKIEFIATDAFYDIQNPQCEIEDGEWDIKNLIKIEESIIFISLYDMFVNEKEWNETSLYSFIINGIVTGNYKWNCDTIERLEKRGEYLHKLFLSIKENGIMTQREVNENNLISNPDQIENDEIMISINRYGNPLFIQNGTHRLCIAKILGIKSIPVKVYKRHKKWELTRDFIFDQCNKFWKGKTYQRLPHPDFDEIETIWSDNRYELIKSNTNLNRGSSLLDIGSLFGYICYRGELDGFNCTACEIDDNYLSVMKKLHKGYNMNFEIITSSFLDMNIVEYDIVVALNILHHFLKRPYEFNKLEKFLEKCKFKEMFVQFHEQGESQMIGSYKDFSPEEFSNFILEKTKKENCILIGEEMNRKIYKIF